MLHGFGFCTTLAYLTFHAWPVLASGYARCLRLCMRPSSRSPVCQSRACPPENISPAWHTITKCGPEVQNNWRSLLVWRLVDLGLQGQIKLKSWNVSHFELVRMITSHPFKLESPHLDQKSILLQLSSLLFWGVINVYLQNLSHLEFLCTITSQPCKLESPNLHQKYGLMKIFKQLKRKEIKLID